MKKVLMLGTGGTIASEVTPSGLAPALTSAELLRCVPEISSLCSVTCEELFSIDSTNVTPAHWLTIARAIRAHYEEYDGFVIAHGTDTMAYTAAALSYLIQYSPKPIILTGAQKPIVFENTDSKTNLADAFRCAVSDLCGVMIVFNGRVILGTRARKTRTVSLQAFSSINYPELAVLQNAKMARCTVILEVLTTNRSRRRYWVLFLICFLTSQQGCRRFFNLCQYFGRSSCCYCPCH